jgi:hypothetical protein
MACEGDCIACHPNLIVNGGLDINHKILANCKNCHNRNTMSEKSLTIGCGKDCFECHDIKKTLNLKGVGEHSKLSKCIKCHTLISIKMSEIFRPKISRDASLENFIIQNKRDKSDHR